MKKLFALLVFTSLAQAAAAAEVVGNAKDAADKKSLCALVAMPFPDTRRHT
jgi:hypothetical protein